MSSNYLFLAGRILFALPLILMGSHHFLRLSDMAAYAASKGVPSPQVAVIVSGLMLVLGAVSILVGYRGRIGAWFVAFFLIGTAFMMHRFWAVSDPMMAQMEMINFFKNIIMAGAAFMMTKTGTGPFSVDNLNKAP